MEFICPHNSFKCPNVPSEPRRIQIWFDFFHVILHICFFKLENCSLYKEKNNTVYLFLVSKPQLFRLFYETSELKYEYGIKIETFRCDITMKLLQMIIYTENLIFILQVFWNANEELSL